MTAAIDDLIIYKHIEWKTNTCEWWSCNDALMYQWYNVSNNSNILTAAQI